MMSKNYNVKVRDDEAEEIKTDWREANRKTVQLLVHLEEAAT